MAACVGPVICTSSSPGRNSPSESFPFLWGCPAARLKGRLPSGGRWSLASEAVQAASGQETSRACVHLASSRCGAGTLCSRVTLPWEGARRVCWAVTWGQVALGRPRLGQLCSEGPGHLRFRPACLGHHCGEWAGALPSLYSSPQLLETPGLPGLGGGAGWVQLLLLLLPGTA